MLSQTCRIEPANAGRFAAENADQEEDEDDDHGGDDIDDDYCGEGG